MQVPFGIWHTASGARQNAQRGSCQRVVVNTHTVSSVENGFLRRRAVGAHGFFLSPAAGRLASASKLLFFRNGEIPG